MVRFADRAAIDALGEFFSGLAKRDVQVICATHSLDLLASMSERIKSGVVPQDSALIHIQRDASGNGAAQLRDATLFRQIKKWIKEDLANRDL